MNPSKMKLVFDTSNLCIDIWKTIFVILEVHFHHERGPSETRYLELFFSLWSKLSPCQKSASTEAPFKFFSPLTLILTIFDMKRSIGKYLTQNLGHNNFKKCKISCLRGLLKEKQVSTFAHFLYLLKPYWPS